MVESLLLFMVQIVPIDDSDIEKPCLITLPGVTVNRTTWKLQYSFSHVPSFFFKLSQSIFFKVFIFKESRWELNAKMPDWGSKVGYKDKFRTFVLLFDNWNDFYSIDGRSFLLPLRPVDSLVVVYDLLPDWKADVVESNPLLLADAHLWQDMTFFWFFWLHWYWYDNDSFSEV